MQAATVTPTNRQTKGKWRGRLRKARRLILLALSMILALSLIGRDDYQPDELQDRSIASLFAGSNFDLIGWEVNAIGNKVSALIQQPAADLAEDESVELVERYWAQAQRIARANAKLNQLAANVKVPASAEANSTEQENKQQENEEPKNATKDLESTDSGSSNNGSGKSSPNNDELPATKDELEAVIEDLRQAQESIRSTVEQIIQSQIAEALADEDIVIANQVVPPVLFSFTEPPKKLVVSPRDRIETRYAQMLAANISLEEIQKNEEQILRDEDLSAYVTNIGGLGAYPTMVIDRASLGWILSTVAHEWVHNYLTLFPLGINYGKTNEITIINETVADIIGDEIGLNVASRYYPEAVPPTPEPTPESLPTPEPTPGQSSTAAPAQASAKEQADGDGETLESDEPRFNFREEMRKTRVEVDRLLEQGKVEAAEQYMEEQRLIFVENGYENLRVLNQAYFAFHGSYGTSAASTSTIGPKLKELREESGSLKAFLEDVRWVTTEAEIDRLMK